MLADRIVVESGETIATVGDVAGNFDLIGDRGIAAGTGDSRAGADNLPDLDALGDRAAGSHPR